MQLNRRDFLKTLGVTSIALMSYNAAAAESEAAERPNILWITCEDISANIGCYGDKYAITPNLDKLAFESVLYTNMYATAPVCSPARSCIITGVHAGSLGTQHLRRIIPKPDKIRCFTEYLCDTGYYCSNNSKQDYQFKTPKGAWDESSRKAHWRKRLGKKSFFSVFNLTMTHQSKTRYTGEELQKVNAGLPEELRHDPAKAPLPPYYPDTKLIRENVAAYYTQITIMDREVGRILEELDQDSLSENTIVFFFSDHGRGLPRGKRWLHHNGIQVPFMIRCPEKYRLLVPGKPGSHTERLVSFVDLAPSLLSLINLPIPDYMQGKPFIGRKAEKPRNFVFASRDRVDEVILCSRTVIDGQYQYIRNFLPNRPRMPLSWYSEKTPIRAELRGLNSKGKLKGTEAWLLRKTTPAEELYDLSVDPHEMNNLANSPKHESIIRRLREKLYGRMQEIRDTGLLPESEMHRRYEDSPYNGMHNLSEAEYRSILNIARLTGMGTHHRETLINSLSHVDSAVRYWSAMGLAAMGEEAGHAKEPLRKALKDSSPGVCIAAAEALCNTDLADEALHVLVRELELKSNNDMKIIEAANALLALGPKAKPVLQEIQEAKRNLEENQKLEKKGKKKKFVYAASAIDHVLNSLK